MMLWLTVVPSIVARPSVWLVRLSQKRYGGSAWACAAGATAASATRATAIARYQRTALPAATSTTRDSHGPDRPVNSAGANHPGELARRAQDAGSRSPRIRSVRGVAPGRPERHGQPQREPPVVAPHDPLAPSRRLRAQRHRRGAADLLLALGERPLPAVPLRRHERAEPARRADLHAQRHRAVALDPDAADREAVVGRRGRLSLRRLDHRRLRGRSRLGLRFRLRLGLLQTGGGGRGRPGGRGCCPCRR